VPSGGDGASSSATAARRSYFGPDVCDRWRMAPAVCGHGRRRRRPRWTTEPVVGDQGFWGIRCPGRRGHPDVGNRPHGRPRRGSGVSSALSSWLPSADIGRTEPCAEETATSGAGSGTPRRAAGRAVGAGGRPRGGRRCLRGMAPCRHGPSSAWSEGQRRHQDGVTIRPPAPGGRQDVGARGVRG
jgi:hypothetical protein